jgi:hypothetical protein
MSPFIIFPLVAAVFLVLGTRRLYREGWRKSIAARTWIIVGMVFALVSAWVWYKS